MIKSNHSKFILLFFTVSIFSISCKLGDDKASTSYGSGVYILNQGQYPNGAGDVSVYNRTSGTVANDLFTTANGFKLGNVVQSMINFYGTNYVVVNNANRIYTADSKTFLFKGNVILDATYPRYMLGIDTGRIYISSWGKGAGDSSLLIFKPNTFTVTAKINTGNGPDKMIQDGAFLYVCNSGGLTSDSTVAVIALNGDSLYNKIQVGLNPNSIVLDASGDVWVLSGGYYLQPNVKGKLQRIHSGKVDLSFDVPQYADYLCTDAKSNVLYFAAGSTIYTKDIVNFGNNPPTKLLTTSTFQSINGMGVDPTSGYLFVSDGKDFVRAGTSYIVDLSAKTIRDSLKVGVAPGEYYFVK